MHSASQDQQDIVLSLIGRAMHGKPPQPKADWCSSADAASACRREGGGVSPRSLDVRCSRCLCGRQFKPQLEDVN
jgi:hypothetical protein